MSGTASTVVEDWEFVAQNRDEWPVHQEILEADIHGLLRNMGIL